MWSRAKKHVLRNNERMTKRSFGVLEGSEKQRVGVNQPGATVLMSLETKKQFLRNNEKNDILEASMNKRFGENQPRDSFVEPTKTMV